MKYYTQERLRTCQDTNHDSLTSLIFPKKTPKETIDRARVRRERWTLKGLTLPLSYRVDELRDQYVGSPNLSPDHMS